MWRIVILLLLAVGFEIGIFDAGTFTPVASDPQAEATPIDPALIARGVEVYRSNYCGTCHTLTVANTRGTFGPAHDDAGLAAAYHLAMASYRGDATTSTEYIRESLLDPGLFYTPGYESTNHHMPAFGHLPPEDIDALVALLASQMGE